ncbi:MAG TPA: CDGSH iron-sulfur domain-containing protein [Actinomycetota bacterium]|nr:CDGSH iron-sulfur domain-containing protein [Actinomycetota bacterium]
MGVVARTPEPSITTYPAGPYLVRGPIRIRDESGCDLVVRRRVVALCRCGRSATKPLCDGSHAAPAAARRAD